MEKRKVMWTIMLLLFFTLALTACGGNEQTADEPPVEIQVAPEATPASTPENCEGFGELSWGDGYEALLGPYVEVVQRGSSFAGYMGSAYYMFDQDGNLSRGVYRFNEERTLTWSKAAEIYVNMRNKLLSLYGQPSELTTGASGGQTTAAPSIYDVIEAGEGQCVDMWSSLTDSVGRHVSVVLNLQADGLITITYLSR